MTTSVRKLALGSLAASFVWTAGPASAHHSFSMFDKTKEITVSGTVSLFQWMNPHTYIWVYAPNAQGEQVLWAVEGGGPSGLSRHGWDKHTINPGDKVTLVVNPLKDGRTGGSFVSLTRADGTKLTENGAGGE